MNARARAASAAAIPTHARVAPDGVADGAPGSVIVPAPKVWAPRAGEREPPTGGVSKRLFDIAGSLSGLILLAPLLLLTAILIRLDSDGPSIFRQERVGLHGRRFWIWKFRTMRVTENRSVVQATANDPRITRLGGFLRRSSWDELPQLVNVLIGDMSLVGPRPHAVEHDQKFLEVDARYAIRGRARPGVTGLAQVNGCRGPTETEAKIRARTAYDEQYVQNWSWWMEAKVLARTLVVLYKGDPGAL